MSTRQLIHTAALLLIGLTAAWPQMSHAQPLLSPENNESNGGYDIHLFLPSHVLVSMRNDRLLLARSRDYLALYDEAMEKKQYQRALAFTDSLITISEKHRISGICFANIYETKAHLLGILNDKKEACLTYEYALEMQDSLMRLEQTKTISTMQVSYQLDRLALDRALLEAKSHAETLISLAMLVLAIIIGSVCIIRINRRLRRLQQELLTQMMHAKESEHKKIAFINAMCHEVRTPLNCVAGFSELMYENSEGIEVHTQYSEIIRDNCRQLRYLFDDLLEVAYLESLAQPLPYRYTDLCLLCKAQLRCMKVRYPKDHVVYEEAIPAEKIALLSNEKYLTLLLSALLNNAYKFTERGTIHLECNREGAEYIRIAVSDTGPGIPISEHENVFDRFTKLDSFSQGNGLGLYLCRLIARHLGGDVKIDSTYTCGTRIVVTLPRRPKDADISILEK